MFLIAAGIRKSTEEVQCVTLLHVIGPYVIEIFNKFCWNQEDNTLSNEKKLQNTAARRVTLLMRDTSSTQRLNMMEHSVIHMSLYSEFCKIRVNFEI